MHKTAISGLAAAAAVLGGAAAPAVAMAQPVSAAHSVPVRSGAARAAAAGRIAAATRIATAMRRAGVAWGGEPIVTPADDQTTDGQPLVSCVVAVDCIAVKGSATLAGLGFGRSQAAATTTAVVHVARWDGSSWKPVGVTVPKGSKEADLNGVSCKGEKSCLIVGDYYTSSSETAEQHALALTYNGTTARATAAVPLPKDTTDAWLSDVSCASVRHCVAVGEASGSTKAFGADDELTLIETWDGATWTLRTVDQASASSQSEVSGVACATDAFCVLTGTTLITGGTGNDPTSISALYVARWNGEKLAPAKAAAVASPVGLVAPTGVSCGSADNCGVTGIAVAGGSASAAGLDAFTEIWDGASWRLATTKWPASVTEALTLGISCYAKHSCEVVGTTSTDPVTAANPSGDAAAVSYDGAKGTVQTVRPPSRGDSDEFTDVSCLSWGRCVAVGDTGKTATATPATMTGTWNGKAWELHPGF